MKTGLIALLLVIAKPHQCDLSIPSGSWTGTTDHSSASVYISSDGNTITVDDFTAGFLNAVGHGDQKLSVTLSIDCSGNINSKTINSEFGDFEITGLYDQDSQQLTLDWSNPTSGINQSSKFNYN